MKYLVRFVTLSALALFVLEAGCGQAEKAGCPAATSKGTPVKKVLIVTGADHPAHDWRQTAPALAEVLRQDRRMAVEVVEDPNFIGSPKLHDYDIVVLHFMRWEQPTPGQKERGNLRKFVWNGKGLFILHFGCGAFYDWAEFRNLAGRVWDPNLRAHDPRGPFRVNITDVNHPITQGMQSFDTEDELYTCLAGERPIKLLATARSKVDDKEYPMAFAFRYGKGRVFHSALGHDVIAIRNPSVAKLFQRGCAWAAGLPPMPK
jgi:type 1 glutamine amidotransferase